MSELKNLMISVSGVRGIVGDGLTPAVALHFAQAYGSQYGPGRIVVGRDSRVTGDLIKYAVWAGLLATGCDVVDIGMTTTPTTAMATGHDANAGGIIITASHNPREWNALKLLAADGLFLSSEEGARILERVRNQDFCFAAWDRVGRVIAHTTAAAEHLDAIERLALVDPALIRRRHFKVVADPCNGAGGTILPQLLERLGCETHFLNLEPHGRFPRSPEPVAANLGELCAAVKTHGADLGIAVDPDVDRLALVSEQGIPLGEEYTLALVTDFVLSHTPGDVVINASTSLATEEAALQHGSRVHRTPVGEIHVATQARAVHAVIAGEGNGGVIYPALHLGRDALVGITLILQLLAENNETLSQRQARLPQYVMVKDRIDLPFDADARNLVARLASRHAGERIDRTDGLKFLYDHAWVHIRASNTEPIIRVIAEARSDSEAHERVEALKQEFAAL
ncbi:MAG TPA: phosphoglucosamine mutase [bacterium]|nr:phosphoglucosamine mutase [bacterium]HQI48068.1 phosphoglucosamine mutase [bacterium]HQJ63314.1 phosphoglucosamine mutase [bacterium]